jgi:bacteriocin-like protein
MKNEAKKTKSQASTAEKTAKTEKKVMKTLSIEDLSKVNGGVPSEFRQQGLMVAD